MNYKDILNNEDVINEYKKIDAINPYPFNHGLKHVKNVCKIMEKLCDLLGIDGDEKEALLIACALHDVGQADGREQHGKKARAFTINHFEKELINQPFYEEILDAIAKHDEVCVLENSLFCIMVQFCDKMDFTKDRLVDDSHKKFGYVCYEDINDVEFILNDKEFGINIVTNGNDAFLDAFFAPDRSHHKKIINTAKVMAEKLGKKSALLLNGEPISNTNF